MELEVQVGRGFFSGDDNKKPDQSIGVIAIDSIFSPVTRVRYDVVAESTTHMEQTCWDSGHSGPNHRSTQLCSAGLARWQRGS